MITSKTMIILYKYIASLLLIGSSNFETFELQFTMYKSLVDIITSVVNTTNTSKIK